MNLSPEASPTVILGLKCFTRVSRNTAFQRAPSIQKHVVKNLSPFCFHELRNLKSFRGRRKCPWSLPETEQSQVFKFKKVCRAERATRNSLAKRSNIVQHQGGSPAGRGGGHIQGKLEAGCSTTVLAVGEGFMAGWLYGPCF